MPQVIVLGLAGAGLYAGCRWLARELRRALEAAEAASKDVAAKSIGPRDLGALEWDAEAGVYRPARRSSADI
jgi:hypothetical protein